MPAFMIDPAAETGSAAYSIRQGNEAAIAPAEPAGQSQRMATKHCLDLATRRTQMGERLGATVRICRAARRHEVPVATSKEVGFQWTRSRPCSPPSPPLGAA